jgi:hypothetical protein
MTKMEFLPSSLVRKTVSAVLKENYFNRFLKGEKKLYSLPSLTHPHPPFNCILCLSVCLFKFVIICFLVFLCGSFVATCTLKISSMTWSRVRIFVRPCEGCGRPKPVFKASRERDANPRLQVSFSELITQGMLIPHTSVCNFVL